VLVLVALLMGVVMLLQLLAQRDLYFVNKFSLGLDYLEFYRASQEVRAGRSPYLVPRYVTPPLPAWLNVPATYWPFDVVKYWICLAVLVSVVGGTLVMRRAVAGRSARDELVFVASVAGVVSLSYPFYFLFDRGNVDGLALLLTALGLAALRRSAALAGVLLALAVATKVYPVLVVLPLAASRRWRPLVAMGVALLVLLALAPGDWLAFVQERLLRRGTQWRIHENGSIACTFLYIGRFTTDLLGMSRIPWAQRIASLYLPVYLALLGLLVLRDVLRPRGDDRDLSAGTALYFPFMIALPRLAYHCELVWLVAVLPAVGWHWVRASTRRERSLVVVLVVGIALGQFQAVAAEKLLGAVYPHFVPGFGLLVTMVGAVALAWSGARAPASARR